MSPKFYIIFIIPALLYLTGCGKCESGIGITYCSGSSGLPLTFVGFDSVQVDSIYVVQFIKGSNFMRVSDTLLYILGFNYGYQSISGIPTLGSYGGGIDANYDSEIIIPRLQTVKISNITLQRNYYCDNDPDQPPSFAPYYCSIASYQQNGSTMNTVPATITN